MQYDPLDYLKAGEILIGLIVGLFSTLIAAFVWWDRRTRRYTNARSEVIERNNRRVVDRLEKLEVEFGKLDDDVGRLRLEVANLPKSSDFLELKVASAKIETSIVGLNEMVDTLYKAALAASAGREKS